MSMSSLIFVHLFAIAARGAKQCFWANNADSDNNHVFVTIVVFCVLKLGRVAKSLQHGPASGQHRMFERKNKLFGDNI